MEGAIFLLQSDDSLIELREAAYDSEDLLQELIANYPNLLAGEQVNRAAPRRWLLVRREAGVPNKADGGNQWSIDNLFLDQEGIPTIVEVKRSSDTRIRREVVGQMLDYAANAVVYWPVSGIRSMFEERCRSAALDPDTILETFLQRQSDETGSSADAFWDSVDQNLRSKHIRMLFVADVIPPELQRIVEFLNEQLNPAEVLAIEIRQYVGQGAKTLVPRVIGQTAQAQATKSGSTPSLPWDRTRFLATLIDRTDQETAAAMVAILDQLSASGWTLMWGHGAIEGSCQPVFAFRGVRIWPMFIWTQGRVQVQFGHLSATAPFDSLEKRQELRSRLMSIPGVSLPDAVDKYPSFDLAFVKETGALASFMSTWVWVTEEVKRYVEAGPSESPAH